MKPLQPFDVAEIICTAPSQFEETIFDLFKLIGLENIWSEQKIAGEPVIHGYTTGAIEPHKQYCKLKKTLDSVPTLHNFFSIQCKDYKEVDWLTEWKKNYKPEYIGNSILILPVWECESQNQEKRHVIKIDPGMAFGTGGHPTTKLCLIALEEVLCSIKTADYSLLDLGCGSAILSIAASKLGAFRVDGVDNDPVALENAQKNASLNGVSVNLSETIPGTIYDVIVSNILAETLITLKSTLLGKLQKKGWLILSGILKSKTDMIVSAYKEDGLTPEWIKEEGDWVCIGYFKGTEILTTAP